MQPNVCGPNIEFLILQLNREVMQSIARALVNRATDTIISTGPAEGAMMGKAHQMSDSVAPAARLTSKVFAIRKSW